VDDLLEQYRDAQADCNQGIHSQCARAANLLRQLTSARDALQKCLTQQNPHLEGIEVTQAIQDLNHSVKLIADKGTVVRVYLSYAASPPVNVRGEITVVAQSPGSSATIGSVNTVTLNSVVSDVHSMRRDAALSLNFKLPDSLPVEGLLEVTLTSVLNTASGHAMAVGGNTSLLVGFNVGSPLRVRILGMRYSLGTPPTTFVPNANDFSMLVSWLRRAYPATRVISTQVIVDATPTPPFQAADINAQLAAIRGLDVSGGTDKRTHYYGMVSDGGFFMRGFAAGTPQTPDPSTVACGPTGSGNWGWDFDGSYGDWYGGHELGHTFGRLHPGFCGESFDDPSYPYTSGQLASTNNSFVGFDVGDPALGLPMAALPGTTWHDVMTYCNSQWLSDYTYEGIRTRLNAEADMDAGPEPIGLPSGGRPDERFPEKLKGDQGLGAGQTLISVVATVNLTKVQGKIQFVHPLERGELTPVEPGSRVSVRFRRADGQTLHEFPVGTKIDSCIDPGQDYTGLLDAKLGVEPDARVIELVIDGVVVDTFRAGATSPSARSLKRIGAESGNVAVAWEGAADTGENITYTVQASTDDGRTWNTLAIGLRQPAYTMDRSNFEGATRVQIRVIATNGFTQSIVTDAPYQLGQ
jgi:hypothetical protein